MKTKNISNNSIQVVEHIYHLTTHIEHDVIIVGTADASFNYIVNRNTFIDAICRINWIVLFGKSFRCEYCEGKPFECE